MSLPITTTQKDQQEIQHIRSLAQIAFKSGSYAMNEATIFNVMMSARDLGVSPFKALNGGFVVINGKISMSTALMTDRIRSAGHSVKIVEWTAQKCVIIGQRKDNGDSVRFEYTMEDAALAELTKSPTWKKYPKHMLYNRCMSTIARVLFPDVVGNCYSEDEKDELSRDTFRKAMESQSDDISVDIETGVVEEKKIDLEQLENIKALLVELGDEEIEKKLCEHFAVPCIQDMIEKDYAMAVKILLSKVQKKSQEKLRDLQDA